MHTEFDYMLVSEIVDWLYEIEDAGASTLIKEWVTCQTTLVYHMIQGLDNIYEAIFGFKPCKNAQNAVKSALDILENQNVYNRFYGRAIDRDYQESLEDRIYKYVNHTFAEEDYNE